MFLMIFTIKEDWCGCNLLTQLLVENNSKLTIKWWKSSYKLNENYKPRWKLIMGYMYILWIEQLKA